MLCHQKIVELGDDSKIMNEIFRSQDSYYIVVNDVSDTAKTPDKSSRPEVFCKKVVPRNFAKFTGKQLCQSLYLKSCRLQQVQLWCIYC